ncbi:MAG: hypothetical protein ACOYJC_10835 [Christensenellales bacterium]|jgi:hypothetical protein
MLKRDQEILRTLAEEIAEIAALPVQEETRQCWYALHRLEPKRPMFMIDELPWNEMNVNDELTLRCEDPFYQYLESKLRQQIYRWKHFRDDFVYDPVIYVPKKIRGILTGANGIDGEALNFGIAVEEDTIEHETGNVIVAHEYFDQLQTREDLQKVEFPAISLDAEETNKRHEMASEALDGILKVEMNGVIPYFNMWDELVTWRGFDNMLYDLVDDPEFMHETVDHVTNAYLAGLDRLEEQGLLGKVPQLVHCCGAWTDRLPQEGYDPEHPRAKDLWTFGMAQIFCTVSPELHNEFEVEYAKKWYGRFGLGYYGCCEPLDDRMDYIKTIPNILKISVSAWVKDYDRIAEELADQYVYSSKPTPAHLIGAAWDRDVVEKDLRRLLKSADRYGCASEFTLKDISTVDHHPEHVWEWADIMRAIAHG